MTEKWVEIDGFNGRYSISDAGNVRANWSDVPRRNLKYRVRIDKPRLLRPFEHTTGYLRVALGRQNLHYVHRLVAQSFLSNPGNLPQVDHVDGNKKNNSLKNLRWVSVKQNALFGGERHGWNSQRAASARRRLHDAKKKAFLSLVGDGYSLRQIAKMFGTSHSSISRVLRR